MAVSAATYEQLALEDGDALWELVCGRLREKPAMTQEHNSLSWRLAFAIQQQLPMSGWEIRMNAPRLAAGEGTFFVPDVAVVPRDLQEPLRGTGSLESYSAPLPFVAEVWSRSTGVYDVDTKFPGYRSRGDAEIWRIHPYDRTVVAWRRQADGSYTEHVLREGEAVITSLPRVSINLDELFDLV